MTVGTSLSCLLGCATGFGTPNAPTCSSRLISPSDRFSTCAHHFVALLAQTRHAQRVFRLLHPRGVGRQREVAAEAVVHVPQRAALAQVAVVDHLLHGQDRRDRHVGLHQFVDDLGARERARPGFGDLVHLVLVLRARGVGGITRVGAQVGLAHRHAQATPEVVAVAAEVHAAVLGREGAVRDAVEVVRSGEVRQRLLLHLHAPHRHRHHRQHALHQTHVDQLADAVALLVAQASRMAACADTAAVISPSAKPHHTGLPEWSRVRPVAPDIASATMARPARPS